MGTSLDTKTHSEKEKEGLEKHNNVINILRNAEREEQQARNIPSWEPSSPKKLERRASQWGEGLKEYSKRQPDPILDLFLEPEEKIGLLKTGHGIMSFFVDNALAVVNTAQYGISGKSFQEMDLPFSMPTHIKSEKNLYSDYYNDRRKRGDDPIGAAFKTALRVYQETPGMLTQGAFVNRLLNNSSFTDKEADELTGYFREGATRKEQIVRAIPEVMGWTKASVMFLKRKTGIFPGIGANKKDLVEEAEKILRKKKKDPKFSILKATDDDIAYAANKFAYEQQSMVLRSKFWNLDQPFRSMLASRMISNVRIKQFNTRWAETNKRISEAKKRRKDAQSKGDKELLKKEQKALEMAKADRIDAIPYEYISIPVTETGMAVGAVYGAEVMGEEWGPLIGALGGGLVGMTTFSTALHIAEKGAKGVGYFAIDTIGKNLGLLDEEALEHLTIKGYLPKNIGLSSRKQKDLNNFAKVLRSLPEESRRLAYGNLKYFQKKKKELASLVDESGNKIIDEELLESTIAQASGFIPLLMMREALSQIEPTRLGNKFKDLSESMKDLFDSQALQVKQLETFKKTLDSLSKISPLSRDDKFNTFYKEMNKFASDQEKIIQNWNTGASDLIDQIIENTFIPEVFLRSENKETAEELIEKLISHKFMNTITDERIVSVEDQGDILLKNIQEKRIPELKTAVADVIKKLKEGDKQTQDWLKTLTKKYFDFEEHMMDPDGSLENFVDTARKIRTYYRGMGSAKFQALDKITDDIDVTNWYVDNYSDTLYGRNIFSSLITDSPITRLKQTIANVKVKDEYALEALVTLQARENIRDVLKNNPEFKEWAKDLIKSSDDKKWSTYFEGEKEPDITVDTIKSFIGDLSESTDTIKDFELLLLLKGILSESDDAALKALSEELKITMKASEIQKFSSGFSKQAREASRRKNNFIATKYNRASQSLVEAIGEGEVPEVAQQIREAKSYWLNNVIRRYQSQDHNPIGWDLGKKESGEYKKAAVEWIDFKKIARGDSTFSEKLLESLARTFGRYDENTNKYILEDELISEIPGETPIITKTKVKYLMNDLFAKYIKDKPDMVQSKDLLESIEKKSLDEAEQNLRYIAQTKEAEELTSSLAKQKVSSIALRTLIDEGLLDYRRVEDYNKSLEVMRGSKDEFEVSFNTIKSRVKGVSKTVKKQLQQRENALLQLVKFEGLDSESVRNPDTIIEYFITSPYAISRQKKAIKKLVNADKEGLRNEEEVKETLSELILESLAEQNYIKTVIQSSTPGQYIEVFAYESFFGSLVKYKEALINIVDEKQYNMIRDLAEIIYSKNRTSKDLLGEGVRYTTPRGLSAESMISRLYSISRGVISPKYVATEAALLTLRKRNAAALASILNDPKVLEPLIDALESGEAKNIRKLNPYMFNVLAQTIALDQIRRKKQRTEKQMQKLREQREKRVP